LTENFFHGYTPIASGNQVYLERPRINRLLEKAVQNPVVTVTAGAGFGKTSAVYYFVRRYNADTAWHQCSPEDNEQERFWKNFVSAVSIVSKDTAKKLRVLDFPVSERQLEKYLEVLNEDVIPNEKYIFVYDDFHLITDNGVLHFMEYSFANAFNNITSILISRTEGAFAPAMGAAKKIVTGITGEDLRFSQNEMFSFFRLLDIKAVPHTASVIYHDTGGWPFAIHLAGLLLKDASSGEAYIPQALRDLLPEGDLLVSPKFNESFTQNKAYVHGFAVLPADDGSKRIYFIATDKDHPIEME